MPFAEGHSASAGLIGEAVAVNIADGATMFVLLGSVNSGRAGLSIAVTPAFEPNVQSADDFLLAAKKLSGRDQRGRTVVLDPKRYPPFVRLRNMIDPSSVENVDPSNLASSFGPGVRLRRVTLEITRDPVTHTIRSRLPWLGEYPESTLIQSHGPYDFSLPAVLTYGDFVREP